MKIESNGFQPSKLAEDTIKSSKSFQNLMSPFSTYKRELSLFSAITLPLILAACGGGGGGGAVSPTPDAGSGSSSGSSSGSGSGSTSTSTSSLGSTSTSTSTSTLSSGSDSNTKSNINTLNLDNIVNIFEDGNFKRISEKLNSYNR